MKKPILFPALFIVLLLLTGSSLAADSCGDTAEALNVRNSKAADDANDKLFVADPGNNRVLVFRLNAGEGGSSPAPLYVLGQSDFGHCTPGTSRSTMDHPTSLTIDPATKRLFVVDQGNNRVLVFGTGTLRDGLPAMNVLGQTDFDTRGAGGTLSTMDHPRDLVFAPGLKRLFVVDANGGTRVLVFSTTNISDGVSAMGILGPPSAILQLPPKPAGPPPSDLDTPRPVNSAPPFSPFL
jgi:hypothetical protein